MEVTYPNHQRVEDYIHGKSLLRIAAGAIRSAYNDLKEEMDHRAHREEYDFLIAKALELVKEEFGEEVKVFIVIDHDVVMDIVIPEYDENSYHRLDGPREKLDDAHADWMKEHGIRRGCWGCDESNKIPDGCKKSSAECGKYVDDKGDFPDVFITFANANWERADELFNTRYGDCP
jgi:hypothetical protein